MTPIVINNQTLTPIVTDPNCHQQSNPDPNCPYRYTLREREFFIQPHLPLSLAPSYDMLPMSLRPSVQEGLPSTAAKKVHPDCPARALELAQCFWKRVMVSGLISENFRVCARTDSESF